MLLERTAENSIGLFQIAEAIAANKTIPTNMYNKMSIILFIVLMVTTSDIIL